MLYRRKKSAAFILFPFYVILLFFSRILSAIGGCSISFSCTLGCEVVFQHGLNGVFISGLAKVGDRCTILHQVTIGSNYGSSRQRMAPELESGVFVGAGAKIIGGVVVGKNSKVGANALVIDNVPEGACCLAPKCVIVEN